MTIQDFQNIHSYHKITAEVFEFRLFWKLSKNIGFHRNYCKMQIDTVMLLKADTLFFKTKVIYSFDMLGSFILCFFAFQNCLLWCAETKRQMRIQENEIFHVRHIVSSIAQQRNSVDFIKLSCKLAMADKVSYQKSRITSPQVIRIFKN